MRKRLPGDALWAAAIFIAAAAANLALRSDSFVFEGLARAMPIDLGLWRELCPGNYILYGPLGWCFHGLLRLLGVAQPAVFSLQAMDALIGAAGLAVYFLTLRVLGAGRAGAAAWTAALGGTLAWWLWSTDAQNYIFSAFLLGLAFHALARRVSGRKIPAWALGALGGLTVLGHIVNALFALPLAVGLWLTEPAPRRRRAVLEAAAAFAAVAGGAYAAALLLVARPADAAAALHWLWGSAGTGQGFRWHGALSARSILQWARMSLNIFVSFSPSFADPAPPAWTPAALWAARLLLAAAAGALAGAWKSLARPSRTAALVCLAWLAAYALVFTSWEPQTMVYRVPDLIPLTTLLFLAWRGRRGEALSGAVLAAALLLANFSAELYPRSFASNNEGLTRMTLIKAATREGDWVTGEGGLDELYIPYFAERRPLVLGRYVGRLEQLSEDIAREQAAGRAVFVTSRVLSDPGWSGYFSRFALAPAAREGDDVILYRLQP